MSISAKTMASVSGMASATTSPARTPSAMKLTTRMIATDCQSEVMKSAMAWSTVTDWSATSRGSMPCGRSAVMRAIAALMFSPERQDVAAVAHGDAEADGLLAVDAEHRLRRDRR